MHRITTIGFKKVASVIKGEIPFLTFMAEDNSFLGKIWIKDGIFTFEGNPSESAAEFIKYLVGGLSGWLLENELKAQCDALAAKLAEFEGQEPLFWYRPCCGGEMYEGPVHNNSVGGKMLRDEKPSEWHGLFVRPVPAEPVNAQLLAVATGRIEHTYNGECPHTFNDFTSRDPECPVCRVITAAEAQQVGPVRLTDRELWDLRNSVATEVVTRDDTSEEICIKHGRAIEAAVLRANGLHGGAK